MTITPTQLESYATNPSPLHGELAEVARELIKERKTSDSIMSAFNAALARMSELQTQCDDAKAALAETAAQRDAAVATVRSLLESYDILMNESPISRSQVAVGVVQGAFIGTVVDARKLLASLVEAPDPNATQ
jgi:hypothetical protein